MSQLQVSDLSTFNCNPLEKILRWFLAIEINDNIVGIPLKPNEFFVFPLPVGITDEIASMFKLQMKLAESSRRRADDTIPSTNESERLMVKHRKHQHNACNVI
jgi:hypothetical protein